LRAFWIPGNPVFPQAEPVSRKRGERQAAGEKIAEPRIDELKGGMPMSKRENEANNAFRSSDRPLSEYEEEQKAQRKNLERLRAERLAREKTKSNEP
jgi:hypothetical protein